MLYYLFEHLLAGRHYVYENPLFRGACGALFCFVVMLVVSPVVIRQLVRFKVGDRPEFHHQTLNELARHKSQVPTMGGLVIVAVVVVSVLLFADCFNFYVQMGLFCLLWLSLLGGVDDWLKLTRDRRSSSRDGLRSYEKLLFQFGLGVVLGVFVFRFGQTNHAVVGSAAGPVTVEAYRVLSLPFYKTAIVLSPVAFALVTLLVVAGTSNAVNLTDGMDGLASGCLGVSTLFFMILCAVAGDAELARKLLIPHVPLSGELTVFCGSILGAVGGFLWYNCHPAQVIMGDTGSLPLGGFLGYVAIVTRQELMLLIVGGVFLIEAVSVIVQVGCYKLTGRRVLRCAPIHHHFQLGGWSETQTVVRFWLVAAMFAGLALMTIKLR